MNQKFTRADLVTAIRFPAALLMFSKRPAVRRAAYLAGIASDALDGYIARKLGEVSESGAKLDSAADLAFTAAAVASSVRALPTRALDSAALSASLRTAALNTGFRRFGRFCPAHTVLNKAAGVLLAGLPITKKLVGDAAVDLAGAIAAISALEEYLLISVCERCEPDRASLLFENLHFGLEKSPGV